MAIQHTSLVFISVCFLAACSSGGGSGVASDTAQSGTDLSDVVLAPVGSITHYGAVNISDDVGMAYDLVGSFFRLGSGVSADFMQSMLSGNITYCQVQDDGVIDFEEISVGFIPQVPGFSKSAVSAGESIVLSSSAGTYATLQAQPAAGFLFYDLDSMDMVMQGTLPVDLTLDVPGSSEIPQFIGISVPQVTPLLNTAYGSTEAVTADTTFTWDPSENPNALVRIQTSTAGGFFLEDGVTISCVAPDSGSFNFPPSIRALLGADFNGEAPIMSRLEANPVLMATTILYVIRESFAAE